MNADSLIRSLSKGCASAAIIEGKTYLTSNERVYGTISHDALHIRGIGPMLSIPLSEIKSIEASGDRLRIKDDQNRVYTASAEGCP